MQISDGKTFQVEGTADAKALRSEPWLIMLENFNSLLSPPVSLKIDKHKCCLHKHCRKCAASLPVTQPPGSLTLNAFLGLKCHQVASELPLLQKNGMGWGWGWGGLRWYPPHLLLPKVVMGLFLNMGRKYLLFQQRTVDSLWDSSRELVLRPFHHGEYRGLHKVSDSEWARRGCHLQAKDQREGAERRISRTPGPGGKSTACCVRTEEPQSMP